MAIHFDFGMPLIALMGSAMSRRDDIDDELEAMHHQWRQGRKQARREFYEEKRRLTAGNGNKEFIINGNGNGKSGLTWLLHGISWTTIAALLTLGYQYQKDNRERDERMQDRMARHEQAISSLHDRDSSESEALKAAREYGALQRQNMQMEITRLERRVDDLERMERERRGYYPKH